MQSNKAGYTASRCVLVLQDAIFSDFYESVTDGRTDGPTDQWTDGPTDRRTDGQTDGHTLL